MTPMPTALAPDPAAPARSVSVGAQPTRSAAVAGGSVGAGAALASDRAVAGGSVGVGGAVAGGSAAVGAELAVEWIAACAHPVLRVLPGHETLMRVVAGSVTVTTAAGTELLELGEETRVPAGAGHRVSAAGFEDARVILQRRRVR